MGKCPLYGRCACSDACWRALRHQCDRSQCFRGSRRKVGKHGKRNRKTNFAQRLRSEFGSQLGSIVARTRATGTGKETSHSKAPPERCRTCGAVGAPNLPFVYDGGRLLSGLDCLAVGSLLILAVKFVKSRNWGLIQRTVQCYAKE